MSRYINISHWGGLESKYTSIGLDCTNQDKSIAEILDNILPHGSGIDYDWHFEFLKNGKIVCHNSYHAMDELGGYCHIYNFSVKIIQSFAETDNGTIDEKFFIDSFSFKGQKENICCGYSLSDYIYETIDYALSYD